MTFTTPRQRAAGWLLALLLLSFILWQLPGLYRAPITPAEAQRYLDTLSSRPLPAEARDELLASARQFMAADDGQPVSMLNLMRFHEQIRPVAGAPDFAGTPREANAYYESQTMPMLFRHGGQPLFAGEIHDDNLLTQASALNHWDRLLVIRYPSRRAFMDLVTDPAYASVAAYKIMALNVVLTPSAAEIVLPPLWGVAALLLALLLASLWRSRHAGREGGAS